MWPNSSKHRARRPSLNEIDAVFRNELEPEFAAIERHRKGVITGTLITAALVALALVAFYTFGVLNGESGFQFAQILVIGGVLGGGWVLKGSRAKFRSEFKERVMLPVTRRFFPELSYGPERCISKSLYDEADLFRTELDHYSGNDLFTGKLGEVDFSFSELLCQYQSGSGKNRHTHTAFRGFFFVGEFHRDFYFRTKIVPDTAESILGVLGRGLQRLGDSVSDEKLIDLENPEFEKLFKATANDQVEARYILTPIFMEKLVAFRRKVGGDVSLSFANGKMFLAISTHHDYFEPRLFGEILSRKDLMKFIDMLLLMTGIAEEFLHHPRLAVNPPNMPPPPWQLRKRND